jgi:hypothetical protein
MGNIVLIHMPVDASEFVGDPYHGPNLLFVPVLLSLCSYELKDIPSDKRFGPVTYKT